MTYDLNGFGWVSNGSQAKLEELYHKIAPYTHRKRKKDVSTDLPDKTYQRIVLEMSDKDYKTYNDIEEGVANDFINQPTIHPLSIMIRLRQFTSHLKINELKEIINTIVETGEKIIIVDEFKEPLYELYEKFKDISGLHTGDQTPEERNEVVKRFQDPDDSMLIFFGTIPTVNYGLTLTAASKMFIMSLPYSVGKYDQVSDRCHRISQKNAVNIYPLIFPDTIDDYVYSSIEDKRTEIVKVMDNEDYKSDVQDSVVNDVIKKIKSKHGK
jgi:SWI/SNF-related matrix-associated actin-dependent regulator 1 of chromatin subfamily A